MKCLPLITILILFYLTATSQENKTLLVIDGTELTAGVISKEQVAHLCSLRVKYISTGEVHNVSSFNCVISSSGNIYKRDCPGTKPFPDNLKNGDVVFIDGLKLDKGKEEIKKQFALTIQ